MSESVHLDEHLRQRLADLAIEEQVSVDDVLRRAVEDYLARHRADEAAWAARFDNLIERRIRAMSADIASDEIDADIAAAIAEVRQARRAAHRS